MKHAKKSAVKARAKRLNQPEVLDRYYQLAVDTTDREFLLNDEDHKYLNTLWEETRKPERPRSRPSKNIWTITSIKRKAERIKDGGLYLEDCIALSSEWNEAEDRAVYTDDAIREIKATWEPKQAPRKPCKNCGGL